MLTPRWDYGRDSYGWSDNVLFLGGTNAFDIYVDYQGILRLTCGDASNENWHWARMNAAGRLIPVNFGNPSDHWRNLFHKDRKNIEAYLACFAPDWRERGEQLRKA